MSLRFAVSVNMKLNVSNININSYYFGGFQTFSN